MSGRTAFPNSNMWVAAESELLVGRTVTGMACVVPLCIVQVHGSATATSQGSAGSWAAAEYGAGAAEGDAARAVSRQRQLGRHQSGSSRAGRGAQQVGHISCAGGKTQVRSHACGQSARMFCASQHGCAVLTVGGSESMPVSVAVTQLLQATDALTKHAAHALHATVCTTQLLC